MRQVMPLAWRQTADAPEVTIPGTLPVEHATSIRIVAAGI
jgi:hypothetical protein